MTTYALIEINAIVGNNKQCEKTNSHSSELDLHITRIRCHRVLIGNIKLFFFLCK